MRGRHYRPPHTTLYVVEGGIATEKSDASGTAPYPHRPDDVSPQAYKNHVRWLIRKRRREGRERG